MYYTKLYAFCNKYSTLQIILSGHDRLQKSSPDNSLDTIGQRKLSTQFSGHDLTFPENTLWTQSALQAMLQQHNSTLKHEQLCM